MYHSSYHLARSKAREVIRAKFFALSPQDFRLFAAFYGRKYGSGPLNYLYKTYSSWCSGSVGMAGQTETRILECVPRFMATRELFDLLQIYSVAFTETLERAAGKKDILVSALPSHFETLARKAIETQPKLDWFVTNIYSSAEIDEYASVVRYAYLDRLRRCYKAICDDLVVLTNDLDNIDAEIDLEYRITSLEVVVKLGFEDVVLPNDLKVDISPPSLVSRHSEDYHRTMTRDTVLTQVEETAGAGRIAVMRYDLGNARLAIQEAKGTVTCEIELRGKGGKAIGRFSKLKRSDLWISFFRSIGIVIGFFVLIIAGFAFSANKKELRGLIGLVAIYGGLGVLATQGIAAVETFQRVIRYERRKTTRIATIKLATDAASGV